MSTFAYTDAAKDDIKVCIKDINNNPQNPNNIKNSLTKLSQDLRSLLLPIESSLDENLGHFKLTRPSQGCFIFEETLREITYYDSYPKMKKFFSEEQIQEISAKRCPIVFETISPNSEVSTLGDKIF